MRIFVLAASDQTTANQLLRAFQPVRLLQSASSDPRHCPSAATMLSVATFLERSADQPNRSTANSSPCLRHACNTCASAPPDPVAIAAPIHWTPPLRGQKRRTPGSVFWRRCEVKPAAHRAPPLVRMRGTAPTPPPPVVNLSVSNADVCFPMHRPPRGPSGKLQRRHERTQRTPRPREKPA